jgi:hypothetical protein
MAVWFTLWTVGLLVLMTLGHLAVGMVVAALLLIGVGFGWYRLIFPRCLRIDSEGLELRGSGFRPEVTSIPYAEIQSLRLARRRFATRMVVLHLVATPVVGSQVWSDSGGLVDLSLGVTEYDRVEKALRRRSPSHYWSITSDRGK